MQNLNAASLAVAVTALLAALPGAQAGLYAKNSPVLQVTAKTYDQLIAKSNHTSIVEFYAPWCGHCKNLQPAYEKAAKHLEGIAKVAAVDCDADENKAFCGSMGVQGFPTLKTVRPGKNKGSKPIVEEFQGQRTAKAIVDAVSDKINNHVTRVTDKDFLRFLAKDDKPKAILFTEKGTTSALLKSLAIDFLDVIHIAQARNKEAEITEKFNIKKYPTLVLLNPESSEPLVYDGEMKKAPLLKFLSQAGQPNPDPPVKAKKAPKDKKPSSSSKEAKPSESSAEATEPSESPVAAEKPAEVVIPPLETLETAQLTAKCLNTKSKTCILAFVPSAHSGASDEVLDILAKLAHKHSTQNHKLFPFYEVDIDANRDVITTLGLQGAAMILAVNGKRNWWRQYEGELTTANVEAWIDSIRLNEGKRYNFPEGFIGEGAAAASSSSTATEAASEVPTETVIVHMEEEVDVQIEPETDADPSLAGTIHAQPTAEENAHDEL
ncbi:uncharacterized protein B0I36DRAFT_360145 [Microdochium trichocladiopsis]|uniref:protein disulfide-isomerase n=1 Tax=Microdochium trichocladiopsis TaxID=1682393 RepID=A0A9P8YA61_9PEZI|nr:uncharacterized protein B0I36DRAFT_360145 [Microdochium trichocladiopsis]KAH7034641.1 hypothetical protein B0I36DRAFT_360145 [Microdochium trichocladiopsis]